MKKRISTRVACLLIAAVMLMGALTVSAINGSPYENLKAAVINALFYENYTLESEFTVHIDGQLYERSWSRAYQGNHSRFDIRDERLSYSSYNMSINPQFTNCDTQWYRANYRPFQVWGMQSPSQSIGDDIFGASGRNSNYLRLAEMVVDLFVGDLKNNLTMNSQGGGIRRVSGAITESQLPEIVRLIIDIMTDEQQRWVNPNRTREDYNHIADVPMRSFTIDRIQGHADIDEYNNLLYVNAMGALIIENIFGETYVMELAASLRFSDIGTTVPGGPFANASDILADFFDAEVNRQLFFTLDEDGNIDLASITDQRPSQQTRCPSLYLPEPTPMPTDELQAEAP